VGLAACASGNAVYHSGALSNDMLGHELGHILQQRRAGCAAQSETAILVDDPALEAHPHAHPGILREIAATGLGVAQPIKMRYGWCNYAHILTAMDEAVAALGAGEDPFVRKDFATKAVYFKIRNGA